MHPAGSGLPVGTERPVVPDHPQKAERAHSVEYNDA